MIVQSLFQKNVDRSLYNVYKYTSLEKVRSRFLRNKFVGRMNKKNAYQVVSSEFIKKLQ